MYVNRVRFHPQHIDRTGMNVEGRDPGLLEASIHNLLGNVRHITTNLIHGRLYEEQ
jgi:hypothetical protein